MEEPRPWLMLTRAPGLGPRSLNDLLRAFDTPEGILSAPAGALRELGVNPRAIAYLSAPDRRQLKRDLDWLGQPDHRLLTVTGPDYPPLLRRLDDAPPVLFLIGPPEVLWQPQVAVVGSRRPSPGGLANARTFAAHLSRAGFAVTSGLATGVDAAAHGAALDAGGLTVAVLGSGPDRVYPRGNTALSRRIAARGALISEQPPGTPPRRQHFPRRNRIISGLSLGVLVVEAGTRSGSLITARWAGEQGRDVFAIPGSIHNPMARGCHRLIRQGAMLVESGDQIIRELAPLAGDLAEALRARLSPDRMQSPAAPVVSMARETDADPDYRALIQALGHDPVAVDILVKRTGLTTEVVSSMLLMLELEGAVGNVGGGLYCLKAETPV